MSKPSKPNVPCGQTAMFTVRIDKTAQALALDGTRWLYPCGLCNGVMVAEPGGLCSTCAPTPPRTRRKTATKKTASKTAATKAAATKAAAKKATKKAAAKKATKKPAPSSKQADTETTTGRRSRAKRTPPWDRVADGDAS